MGSMGERDMVAVRSGGSMGFSLWGGEDGGVSMFVLDII